MNRSLVIIESRFRDSFKYPKEGNVQFALKCCQLAYRLGHTPFASHLFFPQFLDDTDEVERHRGIQMGYYIGENADEVWFCLRPTEQLSEGMGKAVEQYKRSDAVLKVVRINPDFDESLIMTTPVH